MNIPKVWEEFAFCFPGRNSWQYEFGMDHMGALDCISVRLGKAHRMAILACTIGLGSDNPVCVVSTIQFMPSAWDPCPALVWGVGSLTLQETNWLSFLWMNNYAEPSTSGCMVLPLLLPSFFLNKINVLLTQLSESDSCQGEDLQFQCKGRGILGKGLGWQEQLWCRSILSGLGSSWGSTF